MKSLALVFTLAFTFTMTQVDAQTPPCCSPEWCKIFCGENAKNCSTAELQNCKPANCKPSDCKKTAETTPSESQKAVAKTVSSKPSCSPKAVNSKPSCGSKAVAKTVSNKSEDHKECCSWIPGCCTKASKASTTCSPVKKEKLAMAENN